MKTSRKRVIVVVLLAISSTGTWIVGSNEVPALEALTITKASSAVVDSAGQHSHARGPAVSMPTGGRATRRMIRPSIAPQEQTSDAGWPGTNALVSHTSEQQLLSRWEQEADEPEWTRNQTAVISNLLDLHAVSPGTLLDVSCRTSVCRITLGLEDLPRLMDLHRHVTEEQYPFALTLDTEAGRAFAFVARDGMEEEVLGSTAVVN